MPTWPAAGVQFTTVPVPCGISVADQGYFSRMTKLSDSVSDASETSGVNETS